MNNENIIEIKGVSKNWLAKGVLTLALMLVSLYVALLPFVSLFAKQNALIFYIIGGVAFVAFTAYFVYLLYTECTPKNALILSARGFIDVNNIGQNVEIEWTNVTAVKILGKSNMPYLGITLDNVDIILNKIPKRNADEIRDNINQNLPTILIPQSTVRTPIRELKETFVKFAREARVLGKDAPKKQKNNPFTTDDVLRAFGKLPKESEPEKAPEELTEELPEDVQKPQEPTVNTSTKVFGEDTQNTYESADNDQEDEITSQAIDDPEPISEAISEAIVEPEAEEETEEPEENAEAEQITLSIEEEAEQEEEQLQINVEVPASEPEEENDITEELHIEVEPEQELYTDMPKAPNTPSPFAIPDEIPTTAATNAPKYVSASDSFYESLRAKASAKRTTEQTVSPAATTASATTSVKNNENDELPNDIEELLARAKSTRISEIEKILTDDDVPFSLAKNNGILDVEPKKEELNTSEDITPAEEADDYSENIVTESADEIVEEATTVSEQASDEAEQSVVEANETTTKPAQETIEAQNENEKMPHANTLDLLIKTAVESQPDDDFPDVININLDDDSNN